MASRRKQHMSAGVIVVDPAGQILLQLRDDKPDIPCPNHWGITGGGGEKGETPEQTARRELREETGLALERILPCGVYDETHEDGTPCAAHFFYGMTVLPADEMTLGEGQELRFFHPDELGGLSLAFRHAEVLADFLASEAYATLLGSERQALAAFREALGEGGDWFGALLEAVAVWDAPEEQVDGRSYRYLIGGEAFDWLLLAERLCEAVDGAIPADEKEALLFFGRPPRDLDDEEFKQSIGAAKHSAHLNYLYGVIVEEALQLTMEEEVLKEQRSRVWTQGDDIEQHVFERVYGRNRDELLAIFREQRSLPEGDELSFGELREFTYWLFKYRVRDLDPARVASDTRKALAQLSELEEASRRRARLLAAPVVDTSAVIDGEVVARVR
ncbi:MAG: NUDIX domain-containing protein [Dehalococcoidia bacterium]